MRQIQMRLNKKAVRIFAVFCGLAMALSLGAGSARAVEEASLPKRFMSEILPFFETGKKGTFVGKDGVSIAWRAFPPANGGSFQGARAIVISPGRVEPMRKYAELVYDLQKTGDAIYILDHRGQGESGRMLPEPRAGYVKNFHDYVDDLGTFINEVVLKDNPSEVHLIGHSMGADIATIYAIEHPDVLRSMALSSPMYMPNLGKYSECMALALAGFMRLIGREADMAPGKSLDDWKTTFESNNVTHSPNRYEYAKEIFEKYPETIVGGPTYRWVEEAIRSGHWLRENIERLVTPVRIMEAGADQVVQTLDQNELCSKAKSCEVQVLPGSYHETLMEMDSIRDRSINMAIDWINKHS